MFRVKDFSSGVVVATYLALVVQLGCSGGFAAAQDGTWQTLLESAGISSMHTAVTRYDTAVMLDRTNIGASPLPLGGGRCRDQPLDRELKIDCSAHSVMFDPSSNSVRPLFIFTDTWCSSGQFFSDGTLVQTGGDADGVKKIRSLAPCAPGETCDWRESTDTQLTVGRWYASNHILPDGKRQIIIGGRGTPSYEFVPKRSPTEGKFDLPLLYPGKDNLYPYIALLPDGNLWIFAARSSILLNYNTNTVVRNYPAIPGQTRNYPAAGSMTLLPLSHEASFLTAEILICGGSDSGYNTGANSPAQKSCGRMTVTDSAPIWTMEDMPIPRAMGDMILLPTSDVLIINGAQIGSQGWGAATQPAFQPCLYATNDPANRFTLLTATTIPRMYHSTANLLSDGRILLAGSNTHQFYTLKNTAFPTELRVEAFSPPYLNLEFNDLRPEIAASPSKMKYGQNYFVSFVVAARLRKNEIVVECNLHSAPFVTHSYAQGQRQVKLQTVLSRGGGGGGGKNRRKSKLRTVLVTAPPNSYVAPSQYYMLFVVVNGIPGKAKWVQIL